MGHDAESRKNGLLPTRPTMATAAFRICRTMLRAVHAVMAVTPDDLRASAPTMNRAATHYVTVVLFAVRVLAALALIVSLLAAPSVAGVALAGVVALLFGGSVVRWIFMLLVAETDFAPASPGMRVAVVTTYVPGTESLAMLERTLAAMINLDYPHDVWLLDEGDDDAAKALCARLGVQHFTRKPLPAYQTDAGSRQRGMKHGNYNAWLDAIGFAAYDVLFAIDPDHLPESKYLAETLGQLSDPGIAYVQSPQEYYNQRVSLIARGCAEESFDFYWISQRAYHRFRAPSVIGAHGVHRMKALEQVGGFAPHLADDLLLTLRYQMSGWRGSYVPKVLARGLAPVDWTTYLRQQRRWALSLFDIKFRVYPKMASALPLRSRIVGFLQGLTYLQDGVVALCLGVALGAILINGVPQSLVDAIAGPVVWSAAIVLVLTGLYPHLIHGPHRNLRFYWRAACLRLAKWPYTLLALTDVIVRRHRGYELTAKTQGPVPVQWKVFWPHLLVCALLVAAWASATALGSIRGVLPHALASLAILPSVALLASALLDAPAAFDPALADRQGEPRRRDID